MNLLTQQEVHQALAERKQAAALHQQVVEDQPLLNLIMDAVDRTGVDLAMAEHYLTSTNGCTEPITLSALVNAAMSTGFYIAMRAIEQKLEKAGQA